MMAKRLGLGVALHGEVEQDVFRGGPVDDIADVLEIDFKVLGVGSAFP